MHINIKLLGRKNRVRDCDDKHLAMCCIPESCFLGMGSCVWLCTVTLKTITNTSPI